MRSFVSCVVLCLSCFLIATASAEQAPGPVTIDAGGSVGNRVESVGEVVSAAVESLTGSLQSVAGGIPAPPPVSGGDVVVADDGKEDVRPDGVVGADVSEDKASVDSAVAQVPAPASKMSCDSGDCQELGEALINAVEGASCRSMFATGKCPSLCVQNIAAVTSHASWTSCADSCSKDLVTGAAERWAELCTIRQETLIDQGKEAVKSFVGAGFVSSHARVLAQICIAFTIVVVAVAFGYRRGVLTVHSAYRLQKRRLLGRKNSDPNLPL